MDQPVAASRHVRGAAATLRTTWTDENGNPAAAGGAVTVRVQAADGTDIVVAGSSTTTGDTGEYLRALTAAQCATLQLLIATWTDASSGVTRTTIHDICGGVYFSEGAARDWDATGLSQDVADAQVLQRYRRQVEDECELITGVAWVPRFTRAALNGGDDASIKLPDPQPRVIRSVRIYSSATNYTALSVGQLAAVRLNSDGTIVRVDGSVFDLGESNIVVEYEHGFDQPAPSLLEAVFKRLRDMITNPRSGVQERAETFTLQAGGVVRFSQPGLYSTGILDVDAIYRRHSQRERKVPSRVFDYDPTRGSLFHGARR